MHRDASGDSKAVHNVSFCLACRKFAYNPLSPPPQQMYTRTLMYKLIECYDFCRVVKLFRPTSSFFFFLFLRYCSSLSLDNSSLVDFHFDLPSRSTGVTLVNAQRRRFTHSCYFSFEKRDKKRKKKKEKNKHVGGEKGEDSGKYFPSGRRWKLNFHRFSQ